MRRHPSFWKRATVATVLGVFLFSSISVAVPQLTHAQKTGKASIVAGAAAASSGVPIFDLFAVVNSVEDFITEGLITAGKVGVKNAIRSFLEKLAYETATWIASGDKNQKPLLFTKDVGSYLKDSGDAAAGAFLEALASENGLVELNLCDLPELQALQFKIILPQFLGKEPYTPTCTFSEMKAEFTDFKSQAAAFMDNPNSLIDFSVSLDTGGNALSSLLSATDQAIQAETAAERAAEIERLKSDAKDQEAKISEYIQTPAFVVEAQLKAAVDRAPQGELIQQDNIVADAVSIFYNTLAAKIMDRFTSGLLTFVTDSDISDSLSGGSSTAGGNGGVLGAQQKFASFRKPAFTTGGEINILTHFANCPDVGADITNCIINESFRIAIEEGLTVNQAIEQGLIDPSAVILGGVPNEVIFDDPTGGLTVRALKVLKYYDVVPVGWVLAGEYNRDFDNTSLTLRRALDAYNRCDAADYSPYCGLVSGEWVLKAPEVFCRLEGYGEVLANETLYEDFDGNLNTPAEPLLTRLSSCLDPQTCLSEDDTGACEAYGYCTKQEDIYRFEGESCPLTMASCEQFETSDGEEVAYLETTINIDDCGPDNAGCQWYCQLSDTQGNFACVDQDTSYIICGTEQGCSCALNGSVACTVAQGDFSCTSESGTTCNLPTIDEGQYTNWATSFDRDVKPCDEGDVGCAEFISIKSGGNILWNGSFEQFNTYTSNTPDALNALSGVNDATTANGEAGPYDDTFALFGQEGNGEPCTESSSNPYKPCYGWEFKNGATARAVSSSLYGVVGLQLAPGAGDGYIMSAVDTGQPLANRTFSFTYSYLNPSSATCSGSYWIRAAGTQGAPLSASYSPTTTFTTLPGQLFTFPDGVNQTAIEFVITQPTGCNLVVDGVTLTESSAVPSYTDYGTTRMYMNVNETTQCEVGEIGCELYTPETGESEIPVAAKITNPYSSVCGNGNDFSNPACSQCLEEFVGCDAYIETPAQYAAPIKDVTGFATAGVTVSDEVEAAVAQRTGLYCEGTGNACSSDADCGTDGSGNQIQCLPSVSIVPETGKECSAAHMGCEEYVNLESQSQGGEGLEYYTYIRQCVKADDPDTGYYYTFEGSDISGYQIRSWHLKKTNLGDGGPCTNLDVYGASAQTAAADCIDTSESQKLYSCSADEVGKNPDCSEFYDAAGKVYYRLKSATITSDDSCQGLRNTLDGLTYYALPSESTSCPASANMCQEYKGSQGGNVEIVISDDFDNGAWAGGQSSGDVVTASNGQSMAIGVATQTGSTQARYTVGTKVNATDSYIVSFWAKRNQADSGNNAKLTISFFAPSTGKEQIWQPAVDVGTDWQQYSAGPFVFAEAPDSTEEFRLTYTGNLVVVDNLELQRNSSYYLIKGSAELCNGFEGCERYENRNGGSEYLKSFVSLCSEDAVGCSALIDTQNSQLPYYERYNDNNEHGIDDVQVQIDQPVAYVVKQEAFCNPEFAGCELMGLPDLDANGGVQSFEGTYLINDPDSYATALCQEQQRDCQIYTASDGTERYFKDPGDKLCTYNTASGRWEKPDGSACPIQNPNDAPSQPLGPVCSAGERTGLMCQSDSDCPADASGTIPRCSSTVSDQSGWVGSCEPEYAGCSLYLDPNTESIVKNGGFEANALNNADPSASEPDDTPDNWTPNQENDAEFATSNNFYGTRFTQTPPGTIVFQSNCSVATLESTQQFVFQDNVSIKLVSGTGAPCMLFADLVSIDPNKTYTLAGHAYVTNTSTPFAIGLLYYDTQGVEIQAGKNKEDDYAIAAYEGGSRSTNIVANQWMRFSANIGPNLTHSFPTNAAFVRVFIETESTSAPLYVDAVNFSENKQYTYISSTVDGSPESGTSSCNGNVDPGNGCVAFRETTNTSLTYLSTFEEEKAAHTQQGTEFAVDSCTFNALDPSEACDSNMNAADANTVVKVRNDRQCSEWLSCASASVEYDSSGNIASSSCTEIRLCTKRNEDTGVCTEWASKPTTDSLGYADDLSVTSSPINTADLNRIQYLSGYSTVGINWETQGCVDAKCLGGANHGQSCDAPTDCQPAVNYGYYPADWMPERGLGGAASLADIIPEGDFEDVLCNGTAANSYYVELEQSRNQSLSCTIDSHCRTVDSDQEAKDIIAGESLEASNYYEGWCNNVSDAGVWKDNWRTYVNSDSLLSPTTTLNIIDYDASLNYAQESTGASTTLNLNNAMYVKPQGGSVEEGIQVNLGKNIVQDQEYVLSFDAQYREQPRDGDRIQIGFTHGTDGAEDIFEQGQGMADIVFSIDVSPSMETPIKSVAENLSSFIDGLQAAGIDARFAIVTLGANREPHVLDFADYTTGNTAFGAKNGHTTPFTSDESVVKATLDYISQPENLVEGAAENYNAIKEVSDNRFTYRDVAPTGSATSPYSLPFRAEAQRFNILITDAVPQGEDPYIDKGTANTWDQADEDAFTQILNADLLTLYVITNSTGTKAYDAVVGELGGTTIYSLSSGSYKDLLEDITTSIDAKTDDFKFSSNYEHYVLGPLKVTEKTSSSMDSALFIAQTSGSANTAFVIDNVSLKPALEVNKENNAHSSRSTWLVDQQCRAYPESNSLSCNYRTTEGIFYNGWKGYCLDTDSTDPKKCIAWWPVDVLAGEENTTSTRTPVAYSEQVPAYHCLVAKGNADLGACSTISTTGDGTDTGSGMLCSADDQCASGEVCRGKSTPTYEFPMGYVTQGSGTKDTPTQTVTSGNYKIQHLINEIKIDIDSDSGDFDDDDGNQDFAWFGKIPANKLEQAVHISEIDHIVFDQGETFEGDQGPYSVGDITGYDTKDLETDDGDTFSLWDLDSQENVPSDAEYNLNYYFQMGVWCDETKSKEGNCSTGNLSQDALGDADFIYAKAVTAAVDNKEAPATYSAKALYNQGKPMNPFAKDSTFNGNLLSNPDTSTNKLWKCHGEMVDPETQGNIVDCDNNGTFGSTGDITFNSNWSSEATNGGGCPDDKDPCGANIMMSRMDFQDGYLDAIYFILWNGMSDYDVKKWRNPTWTMHLKEPCLLLVESAVETSGGVSATPWLARTQDSSKHSIAGIKYTYELKHPIDSDLDASNPVFGVFGTSERTPDEADGDNNDGMNDFTAIGTNAPTVYLRNDVKSTIPFACIGTCNDIICEGNPDLKYSQENADDCPANEWIGFAGICKNLNDNRQAVTCNSNDDCAGYGDTCVGMEEDVSSNSASAQSTEFNTADDDGDPNPNPGDGGSSDDGSGGGTDTASSTGLLSNDGISGSNYMSKLKAAAKVAWSRYRLIFADTQDTIYYAPPNTATSTSSTSTKENVRPILDLTTDTETGEDFSSIFKSTSTQTNDDFTEMTQCSDGSHEGTDYCGVLPTVKDIKVNGFSDRQIEIDKDTTATLTFDSFVDPDQQPLTTIGIAWEGEAGKKFQEENIRYLPWEAAPINDHTFTHIYPCDPSVESNNYQRDALEDEDGNPVGACVYTIKIQIQDNWGFCSGDDNKTESGYNNRNLKGSCTSYDTYSKQIYVRYR